MALTKQDKKFITDTVITAVTVAIGTSEKHLEQKIDQTEKRLGGKIAEQVAASEKRLGGKIAEQVAASEKRLGGKIDKLERKTDRLIVRTEFLEQKVDPQEERFDFQSI